MLSYSVVICTLDRTEDLKRCISSWMVQEPRPKDIVVVHGRPEGMLEEPLKKLLADTGIELLYIKMSPALVHQRNAGALKAKGDIVFFADDDAVYMEGYARTIVDVYMQDTAGKVGGVQGTIDNFENHSEADRWGLARLFMLGRVGNGSLQPSGWPAFYRPGVDVYQVEVFSGAAMSYRKDILQHHQFDEKLARYWVGDDFEMAYRVSREFRLLQASKARLHHYISPLGRDGLRRQAKMGVVNHLYLIRKCFGLSWRSRLCWGWSEIGSVVVALLCIMRGMGPARLLGLIDGYRELLLGGNPSL